MLYLYAFLHYCQHILAVWHVCCFPLICGLWFIGIVWWRKGDKWLLWSLIEGMGCQMWPVQGYTKVCVTTPLLTIVILYCVYSQGPHRCCAVLTVCWRHSSVRFKWPNYKSKDSVLSSVPCSFTWLRCGVFHKDSARWLYMVTKLRSLVCSLTRVELSVDLWIGSSRSGVLILARYELFAASCTSMIVW